MSHILIVATLALFPLSSQSLSVGHALHIFASSLAAYLAPSLSLFSIAGLVRQRVGGVDTVVAGFLPTIQKALFFCHHCAVLPA